MLGSKHRGSQTGLAFLNPAWEVAALLFASKKQGGLGQQSQQCCSPQIPKALHIGALRQALNPRRKLQVEISYQARKIRPGIKLL
jgi:hypothetical protein